MSSRRSERLIVSVLTFTPLTSITPRSSLSVTWGSLPAFLANNLAVHSITFQGRSEFFERWMKWYVFQGRNIVPSELNGNLTDKVSSDNQAHLYEVEPYIYWGLDQLFCFSQFCQCLKDGWQEKNDTILLIIPKSNHKINLEHSQNNPIQICNILVKFGCFYKKKMRLKIKKNMCCKLLCS